MSGSEDEEGTGSDPLANIPGYEGE